MGCLSMSSQQQRTAIADKTFEDQSQVPSHSAKEIQAESRDDVPRHPSSDKRHKINFPPASSGKQCEDLDSKTVLKIDSLLEKSTLEHKRRNEWASGHMAPAESEALSIEQS
ncbi:reverse transcriptase [Plakobranchus ocellatus]|uniref:Reverse transcriptase n=1 Tax=Plakobranchus ocellatus TaxID=259542 RepID=A0AAV4D3Z5_9GAST|nr:reverse transcriptase [Plakobranchus ocellatus]